MLFTNIVRSPISAVSPSVSVALTVRMWTPFTSLVASMLAMKPVKSDSGTSGNAAWMSGRGAP